MAYRWMSETVDTIRQSPVRAALALILLITTSVFVCFEYEGHDVAEIGDSTSFDEAFDLTSSVESEFVQVSTSDDDSPAQTVQEDGRDKYIDARLTHAFVEESEESTASRTRVTPVSQESISKSSDNAPVWLLGVLIEE